ncbi:ABC transporter FUM19 [Lachnellula suecica]|uniref:ABC transporter FUM19 n=1 Tax=Lachnellula suecica TaxID=602035 RepID=A0A8T9C0M0_9HELO|nr:ABC transporter FUM19 [Lachnellula suecica]
MPSRTASISEASCPILVRCFMHMILLVLENHGKRPALNVFNKSQSPEELSGILEKVFFIWINPILIQGYRNILVDQDLPPLNRDLTPEVTRKAILQTWSQRIKPETQTALPLALLKCVKIPFITAIIPRLFLILFRYSQPVLIKNSIQFVTSSPSDEGNNTGYWLVVSAVVIYSGLAISTSVYQQRLNKLKLLTRSALVGLIHDKTMISPSVTYDNGESTTLMSTDADSLDGIAEMLHEIWAQIVEVVVGLVLLAREVGWIWPLPVFLIFLCSHVSRYVAKQLRPRQRAWNMATQSRVAATSCMLSAMKMVKMLGFQQYLSDRIQKLRVEELFEASRLRWIMVYYNASANALGIFTPAITLVIFAVIATARGSGLDTETAFTSIAILSLVTHPANMVMTFVPRVVALFAGFDRIQAFLLRPVLGDHRVVSSKPTLNIMSPDSISGQLAELDPAILIQHLTIGEQEPILLDINIEVALGSMVVISGPVGSGKSTLIRALIGEVVPARGSIKLSTRQIAYCAQRPWLPSASIKDVIHGATYENDDKWYRQVIDMCCLAHDIDSLPDGDGTQVGSRGFNLSGGQRQRVALARAIFARCDIVMLDDSFSGLDGETEGHVFNNLFGPMGFFRRSKSTVVLVSNSTQYFHTADHIVVLKDRKVKEQGPWEVMKRREASIAKFTPHPQDKNAVTLSASFDTLSAQLRVKDEAELDLSRQTGDLALYSYYSQFAGLGNVTILVICCCSYSFFITIPQYWLQLWTELGDRSSTFYICGFLFLSTMAWVVTNGIKWSTIILVAPHSGLRLHQRLLHIVTSAPLSYFSKTDNGSILNRFSQDIQLIDKNLPPAFQSVIVQFAKLIVQAILLFIAQKWLAASLPACVVLVYIVQKVYLRTSRQLRFLELESRAGIFSSFLESVEGLETIRAFGWSREVIKENVRSLENSQRPEFLLLSLQRWLNIVLDLLSAALATGVVAIAVAFRGHISGGQVGVALNIMLVTNSTLLKLVENWTTLEISLGAVARLKTLEKMTPSEGKTGESIEPPSSWPSEGRIKFKGVTACYNANSVALRDLSLVINPGQKIIICGRTGSTVLLTLLRILELQSGTIELDGVDISRVRLDVLRQRCFIAVSQDTLLLSNETLRFNLDPVSSLSDGIIIDALSKTGLWQHFLGGSTDETSEIPTFIENPVLDKKISLFQELSVGQCQLFGLCRALIKANSMHRAGVKPVVLLDEVSSSLDITMESTIHRIIDEELTGKGYTVIMVAHRLGVLTEHAKPGRDVVVMMGDGRLQEVITDLNDARTRKG